MRLLTAAQVVSAPDLKTEDVPCPEWAPADTTADQLSSFGLRMRSLTALERGRFIQRSLAAKAAADASGKDADFEIEMQLVASTAVDDDGNQVFSDAAAVALEVQRQEARKKGEIQLGDAPDKPFELKSAADLVRLLGLKNAAPVSRCAGVAQKLSGLAPDATKEAVKPSAQTANSVSSTA